MLDYTNAKLTKVNPKDLIGKTIAKIDDTAINVLLIEFDDGSSVAFESHHEYTYQIVGEKTKDVFFNYSTNELSFTCEPNINVRIGETTGTLEDFREWMKQDWLKNGLDITDLPTIKKGKK